MEKTYRSYIPTTSWPPQWGSPSQEILWSFAETCRALGVSRSTGERLSRETKMRHPKIALALSLVISAGATQHALSDGMYVPSRAAPFYNWSGVYLGATAGFANGFHNADDLAGAFLGYPGLANDQSQGFAGGGTLGINWQMALWSTD